MKLWIRSQKGLLLKTVTQLHVHFKFDEGIYLIMDEADYVLGEYESNERALEVLDEIQGILIDYSQMSRVVYQMPEE